MPPKKIFSLLTSNIIITIFTLILLEFFTRIGTYFYTGNIERLTHFEKFIPYKKIDLQSKIHGTGENQYYKGIENHSFENDGYTVSYNSKGFRTPEFLVNKTKIRIASFGGSSTWGAGSENNETWPAFLQKFLDERYPNIFEIINAGQGGYNSHLIHNLVKNEFLKYQTDVAIIYSGYNDHTGGQRILFSNQSNLKFFLINVHRFLLSKSTLYFSMNHLITIGKKIDVINHGEKRSSIYKTNISKIIKILKKNGTKEIIIVKQPLHLNWQKEINSEKSSSFIKYFKNPYFNQETFNLIKNAQLNKKYYAKYGKTYYAQMLILEKIDELEKNNENVLVLDFVNQMIKIHEKDKDIFTDPVHLTPKANSFIARNIISNDKFKNLLISLKEK